GGFQCDRIQRGLKCFKAMLEITSLGDSALIVRIRDQFKDAPEETVRQVLAALRRIEGAQIAEIEELAAAYVTVAVFYDPVRTVEAVGKDCSRALKYLTTKIRTALEESRRSPREKTGKSAIEIPVCFDREFALDLEQVAKHTKLSPQEVIDRYCAATYCVA